MIQSKKNRKRGEISMDYNILDFGAVADGKTNNAGAIQAAIDKACIKGGRVLIPAGEFLSGTICLKSNIDFHLEAGARLISSLNPEDIVDFAKLFEDDNRDTGWDGGCFLFACHEKNITISGNGVIYGQGDKVFFDDDTDGGFHESPLNVTAFRPRLSFLEDVKNLTIRDITIEDAAFWTLHMAGCEHVMVMGVRILNDVRGANNDGIDPDSCKDVIISNCYIEGGDDAIVVKSTKPMAARYGACENITINNCILHSHDSALKIGTETHGDIRNLVMSDCVIKDCSRGVGIWVRDGATIENIHIHHITGAVRKYADAVRNGGPSRWWGNGEPVFVNATYRNQEYLDKKYIPGKIRDVSFDHIYLKAECSAFFAGEEDARLEDISLEDFKFTFCKQGTQEFGFFDEQPSIRQVYEHSIPAVYARCVDGLKVKGKIHFETPYSLEKNGLLETENCSKVIVEIE